jgi:hypothetical protein
MNTTVLHPPSASAAFDADMLSRSNTTTARENVDMGEVSWKCTQVHPVSFILKTQVTTAQALPYIKRTFLILNNFSLK